MSLDKDKIWMLTIHSEGMYQETYVWPFERPPSALILFHIVKFFLTRYADTEEGK